MNEKNIFSIFRPKNKRPVPVNFVGWVLIATGCFLAAFYIAISGEPKFKSWSDQFHLSKEILSLAMVLTLLLIALCGVGIRAGFNAARWIYLVLAVSSIITTIIMNSPHIAPVIHVAVSQNILIALLFLPSSNQFFRPGPEQGSPPFVPTSIRIRIGIACYVLAWLGVCLTLTLGFIDVDGDKWALVLITSLPTIMFGYLGFLFKPTHRIRDPGLVLLSGALFIAFQVFLQWLHISQVGEVESNMPQATDYAQGFMVLIFVGVIGSALTQWGFAAETE